jgi:hypothetical protein
MAASGSGFRWESPPDRIVGQTKRYRADVLAALGDLADLYAGRMEAYAKSNAPWVDQTGNARQGLTGVAIKEATRVAMVLYGDAEYLPYLELGTRSMAPRPIIVPTLAVHQAEIMAAARRIVGDR